MRLAAQQHEEPSKELGDFVEPGSVDSPGSTLGPAGAGAGLEQLEELRAAGLIGAETFAQIEATMANPTAELDRLHASGVMSDEIYAQAMASMSAVTSASSASVDAAELDLLQRGESATATVLYVSEPSEGTNARRQATLEVHPTSGPSYEADCSVAAIHPGGDLKAGDFLRVRVDPEDSERVAIEWAA